nr:uncharacterized protein LOC131779417 [Pocillopora verrucosa]
MFDSSLAKGREPLEFQLGKRKVIKGWEMGIKGMCIGEKRKLIIPPHLGYRACGIQNVIPADSVLSSCPLRGSRCSIQSYCCK